MNGESSRSSSFERATDEKRCRPDAPPVLLLDDGEFDDVRGLLHDLGVDFCSSPDESGEPDGHVFRLIVTNSRHARSGGAATLAGGPAASQRIAICDESSRAVRAQLERSDCDFVVQRPVHTAALRLLILHALYEGPEKRSRPRVALGVPVTLRWERESRPAVLLQLSLRGAGLESRLLPAVGDRIEMVLPAQLTGGASHTLQANVIGVDPFVDAEVSRSFSVVFTPMSSASQSILRQIMRARPRIHANRRGIGSGRGAPGVGVTPLAGSPPTGHSVAVDEERSGEVGDPAAPAKRASARKRYRRAVLATGAGRAAPLLGRDLSVGGMRVAPTRGLALGDELKLALYGPPGVPPLFVNAVAARDDGAGGWVLRFDRLQPEVSLALDSLVRRLPVLASPLRGGEGLSPVVVSEIVLDDSPPG